MNKLTIIHDTAKQRITLIEGDRTVVLYVGKAEIKTDRIAGIVELSFEKCEEMTDIVVESEPTVSIGYKK